MNCRCNAVSHMSVNTMFAEHRKNDLIYNSTTMKTYNNTIAQFFGMGLLGVSAVLLRTEFSFRLDRISSKWAMR